MALAWTMVMSVGLMGLESHQVPVATIAVPSVLRFGSPRTRCGHPHLRRARGFQGVEGGPGERCKVADVVLVVLGEIRSARFVGELQQAVRAPILRAHRRGEP